MLTKFLKFFEMFFLRLRLKNFLRFEIMSSSKGAHFFRFEQRRKYKINRFENFLKNKMINFQARYFLILLFNLGKSDLEGSGINSDDFEGTLKCQYLMYKILNI